MEKLIKSIEQKLFELVENTGENLVGDVHIIQTQLIWETPKQLDKHFFRIYHNKGYCIDLQKEAIYDEETGDFIEYDYLVLQEWEGFDKIDLIEMWELLKKDLQ